MYSIANYLGPAAQELLAAWTLLPKYGCVPYRQNFDPMAVARILPVITLLQRVGDEEWRFRLVGTEVDRRWGRPLTSASMIPGTAASSEYNNCREKYLKSGYVEGPPPVRTFSVTTPSLSPLPPEQLVP